MVASDDTKPTVEGDAGGSKKAAKKAAKAAEKQQKKAEHKASSVQNEVQDEKDISEGRYGIMKLIQSTGENRDRVYTDVKDLGVALEGKTVWVRVRLQTSRAKGKQCFCVLRQACHTVQLLMSVNEERAISKNMVKFTGNITKESIVDIQATVARTGAPVDSCSVRDVELVGVQVWVVSQARPQLPLQIEDAARPENNDPEGLKIRVNQDTRLDNRVLDLRTPANQAIFRIEAGVCRLFRDILTKRATVLYEQIITKESIVDIQATVARTGAPVDSCSVRDVELVGVQVWVVSQARPQLPLQIEDAARPENNDPEGLKIRVNQDTRLDNRVLDLRTPANQAIFRIEAGVCRLFRDILTKR
ncbi:aspartyl-tRNA synthetase, partial [Danaus plexippus plexippus]